MAKKKTPKNPQLEAVKELARLLLTTLASGILVWLVKTVTKVSFLEDDPTVLGLTYWIVFYMAKMLDKFLHEKYKVDGVDKRGLLPF